MRIDAIRWPEERAAGCWGNAFMGLADRLPYSPPASKPRIWLTASKKGIESAAPSPSRAATMIGPLSGGTHGQEDDRPTLAAAQCAARVRGRRQARQLHRRRTCAAHLPERSLAPRHLAGAPDRGAALRAAPARTGAHEGGPTSASGRCQGL